MPSRFFRTGSLLFLAVVFTVGLTFASVELPYRIDELLQNTVRTPGGDSHADDISRLKTELFMAHFHVRAVGYAGFFLLLGLIVAGFSTKRTGLAALGAFGVMLPVFAQFAGVMFFLAGLGALNALWLPVLDLSYGLQDWGLVIRAPNDLLRWILGLVGVHSAWPTILFFIGAGIFVFLLGVYAWLTARSRKKGVADFWVYRISRHPQYLGWILWTYGAFLMIQLFRYPKRSWGIGASLPWLLSTMVIVGVALIEELNMRRRHGEAYESYRRSAPFLFPVPRWLERAFATPFRWLFGKERVERKREVAVVVALYTAVLMGISALFYAGGWRTAVTRLASADGRAQDVESLVEQVREESSARRRFHLMNQIAAFGEPAVEPLIAFLEGDDPALRPGAAEVLGSLGYEEAVPALCDALSDPDENLRYWTVGALRAIQSPQASDALRGRLTDTEAHIRVGALHALAELGDEIVLEWAPSFLADESHWVRGSALDALGALGSEAAVPEVETCLADEHEWVRREAVLALLRIGSPAGRPGLEQALSDEDFEVRVYAAEALKRVPVG
jgi:protein-S-isoprenylcysteine O-methyltransferase Ste14